MDQIAALHWLQENIAVFGGDPTNVTIIGHGTGAACINFLMTSSAVPDGELLSKLASPFMTPLLRFSSTFKHFLPLAFSQDLNSGPTGAIALTTKIV
jgi:carboxylesterase type B